MRFLSGHSNPCHLYTIIWLLKSRSQLDEFKGRQKYFPGSRANSECTRSGIRPYDLIEHSMPTAM